MNEGWIDKISEKAWGVERRREGMNGGGGETSDTARSFSGNYGRRTGVGMGIGMTREGPSGRRERLARARAKTKFCNERQPTALQCHVLYLCMYGMEWSIG